MKYWLAVFIGAFIGSIIVLVALARSGAPAPGRAYREDDDGIQPPDVRTVDMEGGRTVPMTTTSPYRDW